MIEKSVYGRWSDWESAVLSKVGDITELRKVIAQRSGEADGDDDETSLVDECIRVHLKRNSYKPDEAFVFIPTKDLAEWIKDVKPEKAALTRVTPYLKTVCIPELKPSPRRAIGCGWIWRGNNCESNAKMSLLSMPSNVLFDDDPDA